MHTSPIQEVRSQLRDAKTIVEDMLTQPIEPSLAVSYARDLIEGWDRLTHLEGLCLEIENELTRLEEKLVISGHFGLEGSQPDEVPDADPSKSGKSRPLRIEVSEGMIRQNLFTLTAGVKRGLMKARQEIQIQLPNGDLLTSKIMPPGNRLQERGRIRRLYLEYSVKSGDFITLEKLESGVWKMMIEPRRPKAAPGLSL